MLPRLRFPRVAALVTALAAPAAAAQPARDTFVLVHGAWGGGWDWWQVDSLLTARGHRVQRVTLTGLGERVHLASPQVGLETHIQDVVNTILFERLDDVVLVGHSYGGVVVTGAADRIPDRIGRRVYVDAILPESGESVQTLMGDLLMRHVRGGFLLPSWEPADRPFPRDVPHPVRTFTDTLRLAHPSIPGPADYILTLQPGTPEPFARFAERAARRGWPVHRMEGDHVPERSQPAALVRLLLRISGRE